MRESEGGSEATVHAHLNRIKASAVPALRPRARAIMLQEGRKDDRAREAASERK